MSIRYDGLITFLPGIDNQFFRALATIKLNNVYDSLVGFDTYKSYYNTDDPIRHILGDKYDELNPARNRFSQEYVQNVAEQVGFNLVFCIIKNDRVHKLFRTDIPSKLTYKLVIVMDDPIDVPINKLKIAIVENYRRFMKSADKEFRSQSHRNDCYNFLAILVVLVLIITASIVAGLIITKN